MTEVAKTWDRNLYPELEQAGGLPQALQPLLAKLPGELVVEGLDKPILVYAQVRRGSRSSQVMIAARHRAFSAAFFAQGVHYGTGWAKSLQDVAAAIHAFQIEDLDVATLEARHKWVSVDDQAFIHERGPSAFVEHAWQGLLTWLAKEPPDSAVGMLLPLVRECMQRTRLRRLMPFTSMDRLHFSRTTGFPYSSECPPAFPLGRGRFRIDRSDTRVGPIDGDAKSIAEALEAALAPDCTAAIHGTAEDGEGTNVE